MDALSCLVQDTSEVPIPSRTPDKGQDVFKELSDKVSTQLPAHCCGQAAALQRLASLGKGDIILHNACNCFQREPIAQ